MKCSGGTRLSCSQPIEGVISLRSVQFQPVQDMCAQVFGLLNAHAGAYTDKKVALQRELAWWSSAGESTGVARIRRTVFYTRASMMHSLAL